jgi:hypothetical protein
MPIAYLHNHIRGRRSVLHRAALSIIVISLSGWFALRVAAAKGDSWLPNSSEIPGWGMVDKPYRYVPDDLYKYINGEAEFFLGYGFVSLAGANYASEADNEDFITVDIYNMGEKLNAFGVFQAKRSGAISSLNIGTACFGAEGYLAFYKDRYYVEILSFVKDERWKAQHVMIARNVAEEIQGDMLPPYELSYLPESGRIEGSERYLKGGILGHGFLDRGLTCDYSIKGDVVSAFVAFFTSSKDAGSAFRAHKDFLRKAGKECVRLNGVGERAFVSQEPYHKNIVVMQEGSFVIGVYDLLVASDGMELLKDIVTRIKTSHEAR